MVFIDRYPNIYHFNCKKHSLNQATRMSMLSCQTWKASMTATSELWTTSTIWWKGLQNSTHPPQLPSYGGNQIGQVTSADRKKQVNIYQYQTISKITACLMLWIDFQNGKIGIQLKLMSSSNSIKIKASLIVWLDFWCAKKAYTRCKHCLHAVACAHEIAT